MEQSQISQNLNQQDNQDNEDKRQHQQIAANGALPAVVVRNGVANISINNNRRKDDKGNIETSVYWNTYFYTPNDEITQIHNQIVEYYENLPASLIDGLGNLEVIDPEPIKEILSNSIKQKIRI